jgi:hypothetical protein
MLRIGKNGKLAANNQQVKPHVSLGDLYQLYTQAEVTPGKDVQLAWSTDSGHYTMSVRAERKQFPVWQLMLKRNFERVCLWTIVSLDVPAVHRRLMMS